MSDAAPDDWLLLSEPDAGELEVQLVQAALAAPRWSSGRMVERFEAGFARWVGRAHAVAVPSGTVGTWLALRALGIGPGDEVIASTYGWHQVAQAVSLVGARLVFSDINYWSGCLDPARAAAQVTPATRAIIAGNVNGHPADWTALSALARARGLALIEDSTEALGSRHRGADGGQLRRRRRVRLLAAIGAVLRRGRHAAHRRWRAGERAALPARPCAVGPPVGVGGFTCAAAGADERADRGAGRCPAGAHRCDPRASQGRGGRVPRTHAELRGHQAAVRRARRRRGALDALPRAPRQAFHRQRRARRSSRTCAPNASNRRCTASRCTSSITTPRRAGTAASCRWPSASPTARWPCRCTPGWSLRTSSSSSRR